MLKERNKQIFKLFAQGYTYQEIGRRHGISRQRVQQIVRPPMHVLVILRKRAKDSCETCGIPLPLGDGHVHHKEKDVVLWKNNLLTRTELEKLLYLCPSCHRTIHAAPIERQKR